MFKYFLILLFLTFKSHSFELYTVKNHSGYTCDQFPEIFDEFNDNSNVLFYVHGRGKHPTKGLAYLSELERRYGVKVMMFHWDSWINYISRPELEASLSAHRLDNCLNQLSLFMEYFPNKIKLNLMVHSMGNIVFKSMLKNTKNHLYWAQDFFDVIILNAPDVDSYQHKSWVDQIGFSKKTFISFNREDAVLIGSKIIDFKDFRFFRGKRLGLSPYRGNSISDNVTYLDFSKLSIIGHEYFLSNSDETNVIRIYQSIFNGKFSFPFPHRTSKTYPNIIKFDFF